METAFTIPKENLTGLQYPKTDVLSSLQLQVRRKYQLNRAMLLGNLYHTKVRIIFRDFHGIRRMVETTVWTVGEEYISLKGGRTIPVRAIEEIEF
ncbi:hypothetical protein WJR50_21800 [Catalinimonas sp. 4WD22]|uniref:hypothetical protein n=1 Tax=Catalinimonas locisalis TaxID=3133978 RepID=UPI003100F65D